MNKILGMIVVIGASIFFGVSQYVADLLNHETNVVLVIQRKVGSVITEDPRKIGYVEDIPVDKIGQDVTVEIVGSRGKVVISMKDVIGIYVETGVDKKEYKSYTVDNASRG